MKISFDEAENTAYIKFSDHETDRTLDEFKYLTYELDQNNNCIGVHITDVDKLGIDIIRATYMDEDGLLEYLEELREEK